MDLILPGQRLSDFTLNGSGRLVLQDIDVPELDVAIRGSGEVEATGRADDVDLSIAGAGEAHLGRLAAKSMDVQIAGAGEAEIAPEDEVEIMIAGAGEIRLLTQPRSVEQSISAPAKSCTCSAQPRLRPDRRLAEFVGEAGVGEIGADHERDAGIDVEKVLEPHQLKECDLGFRRQKQKREPAQKL